MSLIKLPVPEDKLQTIVKDSVDYALSNGIVMGSQDLPNGVTTFSPFCFFPSEFSLSWFNYAKDIQTTMNLLVHRVSYDEEFLKKTLERTVKGDEFTGRLFKIYEQVYQEGIVQDTSLGILRSDYMLNVGENGAVDGLKQVEINTIAASFSGLASKLHGLQSNILRKLDIHTENFPATHSCKEVARGLIAARKVYGKTRSVIVFLVEEEIYNFSDQRALEYDVLQTDPLACVMRLTFKDISEHGTLRDHCLFVFDQEIAVVYYRTGYMPHQYSSEKDWEVRLMIERSQAIKCPSISYHLAGTKKVQQTLAAPGVLERFLESSEQVELIRKVFANQYTLDLTEAGDKVVELALKNPEKFVMKPQREGGGNNIYGKDIVQALEKLGKTKERETYILMELINAPIGKNYIIRYGNTTALQPVISELGIYGVILGNAENIIENYTAGHMLRSKAFGLNEGGVVAGYGALDLPLLS